MSMCNASVQCLCAKPLCNASPNVSRVYIPNILNIPSFESLNIYIHIPRFQSLNIHMEIQMSGASPNVSRVEYVEYPEYPKYPEISISEYSDGNSNVWGISQCLKS